MDKPVIPFNEEARLRALRALGILDTAPEERFDRLTRIAQRLFDVPIALVSLVDDDRQWFKARAGLDVAETPRDISFCGHAILGNEVFIVPDATADSRFADNPLVTGEPHIRFYAGCPLRHLGGTTLGTLCIIDQRPRTLSDDDIQLLNDLAATVEREIAAMELATQDDLTGLANRRGFLMLARQSLSLCARQNIPATLVFIDLDGLKSINDNHGHPEGDRAIRLVAGHIAEACRDTDIAGRLGGDEFVALLPNTTPQTARSVIARIAELQAESAALAALPYEVRFSHGIVEFDPQRHRGIQDLLAEGDQLMYRCKQQKRGDTA